MRLGRATNLPERFFVNDTYSYMPQSLMRVMYEIWVGSGYEPDSFRVSKALPVWRQYLTKTRLLNRKPLRVLSLPA